jgi:hypothetical protein
MYMPMPRQQMQQQQQQHVYLRAASAQLPVMTNGDDRSDSATPPYEPSAYF